MSEDKPHKQGLFEKRRERKRLKHEHEHEGDTPEKREESSGAEYDAKEAKAKAGWSGLIGGGGFGG